MSAELLSPAGDFETALAAFDAGADAVYCGLGEYSARAYAGNFTFEELSRLVSFARSGGKKVYVAPKRSWAYTKMAPPGLPGFFAVREATWERVAWSSVDWGDEEGGEGEGGGGEGGG